MTATGVPDPIGPSTGRDGGDWYGLVETTLASCTTRSEVMGRIPEITITGFADWCGWFVIGDTVDADGSPPCESAARDRELDRAVRTILTRRIGDGAGTAVGAGGPTGHVDGTARIVDPALETDATGTDLAALGVHSWLRAPLEGSDGSSVGTLHLLRTDLAEPFRPDDLTLVRTAVVRLLERLDELAEQEEDRELLVTFQEALLPDALPDIPGLELAVRSRPAGSDDEISGDFYDVIELDGGRCALVIGDVMGHGARAAAVTALARHSTRMSAWHGDRPDEILGWLDHALEADDDHSCTAAVVTIEPTGTGAAVARCALGGHPRPLVCRADGTVEAFGIWGTVLGSVPDPKATTATTRLDPGDVLVLHTDGITDLGPGMILDEEDLVALVRTCWSGDGNSEDLLQRILEAVADINRSRQFSDDVALLAARLV